MLCAIGDLGEGKSPEASPLLWKRLGCAFSADLGAGAQRYQLLAQGHTDVLEFKSESWDFTPISWAKVLVHGQRNTGD